MPPTTVPKTATPRFYKVGKTGTSPASFHYPQSIMVRHIYSWLVILLTVIYVPLAVAAAGIASQPSVLVLYDATSNTATPSMLGLLTYLRMKTSLILASYDDKDVTLFRHGAPIFDTVIVLPLAKKNVAAKSQLLLEKLLQFTEARSNVIVVGGDGNSTYPAGVRAYLNEVGIFPAPPNHVLVDHFHGDGLIEMDSRNVVPDNGIISTLSPVEFHGSAAILSNNQLLIPLIRADETAFTADQRKSALTVDGQWASGMQAFVAAGFQARNNARVLWVGSETLFANTHLFEWALKARNNLKLTFVQHSNMNNPSIVDPPIYRIKDNATYMVGISEFVDEHWQPYIVEDPEDLPQLAFRMLDPYQRLDLLPLGVAALLEDDADIETFVYYTNFTIPDHHGVFTFELDYTRKGFTYLGDERAVTVRHLANDEFKRSWEITNAWPYIASAGSVVAAWFLFVMIYIYVSNPRSVKKDA